MALYKWNKLLLLSVTQGVGKSKKHSKRDAALKMLQQVKDGMMVMPAKGEMPEDNEEDSMPLVGCLMMLVSVRGWRERGEHALGKGY